MSNNEESKEEVDEQVDAVDVCLNIGRALGNIMVNSTNSATGRPDVVRPAFEHAIIRYHQGLDSFRFADASPGAPECAFTGICCRGGEDFLRSLEQDEHVGRTATVPIVLVSLTWWSILIRICIGN